MRRRLLNKMQTEQNEQSRSEAVKARLVPAINYVDCTNPYRKMINPYQQMKNDSAAFQGEAQSSPQGSVPPAPAAPLKRGPGRPRKNLP